MHNGFRINTKHVLLRKFFLPLILVKESAMEYLKWKNIILLLERGHTFIADKLFY